MDRRSRLIRGNLPLMKRRAKSSGVCEVKGSNSRPVGDLGDLLSELLHPLLLLRKDCLGTHADRQIDAAHSDTGFDNTTVKSANTNTHETDEDEVLDF